MSVVIKTLTPFTEQDVLVSALKSLGIKVDVVNGELVTNRQDYQGFQKFIWNNSIYQLQHDSHELSGQIIGHSIGKAYTRVKEFLALVNTQYQMEYSKKLERVAQEERDRLERERLERVELTTARTIEKARSQGYSVTETRKNGKVKLVLTRTVY